jgi:hypothetical protein
MYNNYLIIDEKNNLSVINELTEELLEKARNSKIKVVDMILKKQVEVTERGFNLVELDT